MQDIHAERRFYAELFARNPENEHITSGYDELHELALRDRPEGPVLDLGCGTGAHAVRLAARGCDVIALDLTREGVWAARGRFERAGLRGRFIVADAEHIPLRDRATAVTWTFLLLHHFPRLDKLPQELSRVTRHRIIALEPNAQNLLTWFANNVVNRFIGISAMTRNQRALWPTRIRSTFARQGFRLHALHYVDRRWSDKLSWVRALYDALTAWLPMSIRANKFLILLSK